MKKILFAVLATLLFPCFAQAQSSDRSWEIRNEALLLSARWISLEGMYLYQGQWAFGPSVILKRGTPPANMFFPTEHGYSLGAAASYYFVPDSPRTWYLTTRYHWEDHTVYIHGRGLSRDYKGHSLRVLAGYRLNFWNRFFFMPGAGLNFLWQKQKRYSRNNFEGENSKYRRIYGTLEAKIGVEF